MPKGYLKGCEDIVNKNQIGFSYTNYKELYKKLINLDLMNEYKINAILKSKKFILENNFKKIDDFIKSNI